MLSEMLPEGIVTDRAWLAERGFSRHAIDNLVKSNGLTSLHHGVYVRGIIAAQWQAVVFSLQSLLDTDLVVGGLTALEIQGFAHYLSLSNKKVIHVYGSDKLPTWVDSLIPDISFVWHNSKDLAGRGSRSATNQPLQAFVEAHEWREGLPSLVLSSPERAFLELLADVPEKISFEHADHVMQGMTSLSPRALQPLLESTDNVKVKRLFFWLADRHKYPWLQKLDKEKIEFGAGNRMLLKGGKFDKEYLISVPHSL